MKGRKSSRNKILIIISIVGLIVIVSFIFWQNSLRHANSTKVTTDQHEEIVNNTPEVKPLNVASDETLGSGFAVKYPDGWTNVHTGASQPQSATKTQTDENIITSPSGNIQVVLRVQTIAQVGGACRDGYIKLKYLKADADTLPAYHEGRFAAYVVYFPDFKLYQYHVGLQKNTEAIRAVNLENNTACNFMFSEFIQRNSSLPNVPLTTTKLSINFVDLVSKGQNLKAGINETNVAEKLSGTEYDQAKTIVQSLHTR